MLARQIKDIADDELRELALLRMRRWADEDRARLGPTKPGRDEPTNTYVDENGVEVYK